jgi:hypothetical protein
MYMSELRKWLIQRGVPAEELDEVSEPPVISDIGQTLLLSLQNDDAIATLVMSLVEQVATLEARVAALEGGEAGA